MANEELAKSSTTAGLPVAPSMGAAIQKLKLPVHSTLIDGRVVYLCGLSIVVGIVAGYVAQLLIWLIWFFTNLSFFHRFSFAESDPRDNPLGWWVVATPVMGGLVIGLIARFGSREIAGHGIPEAMENVLLKESRIPPKMAFLKPVSAAISIGTGGPFGAEGPIIATGGALGSLLGQLVSTTSTERKTLLAAGAAAGISAAFGSPIAAIFLAIELLLFEFRPRSILPVALASAIAAVIHNQFEGTRPFFPFSGPAVHAAGGPELGLFLLLGAVVGIAAAVLTRTVYAVEDFFETLPIHWMWHPAIGALAVGIIGALAPRTFGSGYYNLHDLMSGTPQAGKLAVWAIAGLLAAKFLAWTISLGSGTTGGTLAPVFTIGGAFAALVTLAFNHLFPDMAIDLRLAALAGMVAIFAGASRALLTSVAFAYETSHEPAAVLPALVACVAAYIVSALLMRDSIMSEKMARAGVRVPADFVADFLDQVLVKDVMGTPAVTLQASQTVDAVRRWLTSATHDARFHGYPVVDENGSLVGILTRREVIESKCPPQTPLGSLIARSPVVVYGDSTVRDAADHMVNHDIGRLPVIDRSEVRVIGMITRTNLLQANRQHLRQNLASAPTVRLWKPRKPATANH
ncbi:MAG TPA: chloride channel protein [Tepidisphaeraceae bacterium]|nr:chloride channel protein [Tepidisphaeraceae bacterium]